jgi:hypothetical protein
MTTQEEYAERRERWAQALESGKYAQAAYQLRSANGYCCLGVACDLYIKEQGGEWEPMKREPGSYQFKTATAVLPPSVKNWLGIRDQGGRYGGGAWSLTSANDDGKSFAEIAAIIRAAPEGLFDDA